MLAWFGVSGLITTELVVCEASTADRPFKDNRCFALVTLGIMNNFCRAKQSVQPWYKQEVQQC